MPSAAKNTPKVFSLLPDGAFDRTIVLGVNTNKPMFTDQLTDVIAFSNKEFAITAIVQPVPDKPDFEVVITDAVSGSIVVSCIRPDRESAEEFAQFMTRTPHQSGAYQMFLDRVKSGRVPGLRFA